MENNESTKEGPVEEGSQVEEPKPEDKKGPEALTNEWQDIHSFLTSPEGLQVLDARLKQLLGE